MLVQHAGQVILTGVGTHRDNRPGNVLPEDRCVRTRRPARAATPAGPGRPPRVVPSPVAVRIAAQLAACRLRLTTRAVSPGGSARAPVPRPGTHPARAR